MTPQGDLRVASGGNDRTTAVWRIPAQAVKDRQVSLMEAQIERERKREAKENGLHVEEDEIEAERQARREARRQARNNPGYENAHDQDEVKAIVELEQYCVQMLRGHEHTVMACRFDPTHPDTHMFTCGYDHTAKKWDLRSGECLQTYEHQSIVLALAVNAHVVVSGSRNNCIKVWDKHSGKLLRQIFSHKLDIKDVTIMDDGTLASTGYDGEIHIYHFGRAAQKMSSSSTLDDACSIM